MVGVEIDSIDRVILFELIQDCRKPIFRIARELKLPRKSVENRIRKLEKNGIITKYTINVNNQKLGLNRHSIYIKLKGLKSEEADKCIKKAVEIEGVSCCYRLHEASGWKIYFSTWTKTLEEYDKIQSEILKAFGENHIENYISFQSVRSFTYFARRLNPKKHAKVDIKEGIANLPLKEIDHKIIHELKINSRIPLLELANKLKTNISTIKRRISYLTKNDIVQRFYPIIDRNKLGYVEHTYLARVDPIHDKEIDKFIEYAKKDSRFVIIIKAVGYVNLYYAFLTKDDKEMEEIDAKIESILGEYTLHKYKIEVERMIS